MQKTSVYGVILSGGLARRMNGCEKGLQLLAGKPLISHILKRLVPQVESVWLNINREQAQYQTLYPHLATYSDRLTDFQGPLSGMLSGFEHIQSEYLLFVPCDTPFLPTNLLQKLQTALRINQARIAYAHDGQRAHPTFALLHRSTVEALRDYLAQGERRLLQFFQHQGAIAVDFSEQPEAFVNFNSLEELAQFQLPKTTQLLAVTGYSGTGKTTLLEKLIPVLNRAGLKVGLIKHSHHHVDVDKQGKDSYRLRMAGANPTMIVCQERWALMVETPQQAVNFEQFIANFAPFGLDLILVEGFKDEPIPKIQLHRQGIDKPLPDLDAWTIATATDYPLNRPCCLDINRIDTIADFIQTWLATGTQRS